MSFPATFDFGPLPQQPPARDSKPAFPRLAPPKNGFPASLAVVPSGDPRSLLGSLVTQIPAQSDEEYVAQLERHVRQLQQRPLTGVHAAAAVAREEAVVNTAPLLDNVWDEDDRAEHDFGSEFEATEPPLKQEREEREESEEEDREEEEGCCC